MKSNLAAFAAAFVFMTPATITTTPTKLPSPPRHPRPTIRAAQIAATQTSLWRCQNLLGLDRSRASVPPWNLSRSTKYRRWVLHLWQRRHASCEAAYVKRAAHTLPATNDWQTAVRVVQRVYPGTASWMLYISHREGGYGPWVWYGGSHWTGHHIGDDYLGSDTVGGWMQFRYSTFAPYWRHAQADLRARGWYLPKLTMPPEGGDPQYVGWLSPLAQALTAGYMRYTGKDGCHWCL